MLSREGSLASCGSLDALQLAPRPRREGGLSDPACCAKPEQLPQQQQEVLQAAAAGAGEGGAAEVPLLDAGVWAQGVKAVGSSSCLSKQQLGAHLAAACQQQLLLPAELAQQPSPLRERMTGMTLSDGSAGSLH